MQEKDLPLCKTCGTKLRKIIYGLVAGPLDRNVYVIGGCLMGDEMPEFACPKCDADGYNFEVFNQIEQE